MCGRFHYNRYALYLATYWFSSYFITWFFRKKYSSFAPGCIYCLHREATSQWMGNDLAVITTVLQFSVGCWCSNDGSNKPEIAVDQSVQYCSVWLSIIQFVTSAIKAPSKRTMRSWIRSTGRTQQHSHTAFWWPVQPSITRISKGGTWLITISSRNVQYIYLAFDYFLFHKRPRPTNNLWTQGLFFT